MNHGLTFSLLLHAQSSEKTIHNWSTSRCGICNWKLFLPPSLLLFLLLLFFLPLWVVKDDSGSSHCVTRWSSTSECECSVTTGIYIMCYNTDSYFIILIIIILSCTVAFSDFAVLMAIRRTVLLAYRYVAHNNTGIHRHYHLRLTTIHLYSRPTIQ